MEGLRRSARLAIKRKTRLAILVDEAAAAAAAEQQSPSQSSPASSPAEDPETSPGQDPVPTGELRMQCTRRYLYKEPLGDALEGSKPGS